MTLGDIYGKINRSGNESRANSKYLSSEDGSSGSLKKPSAKSFILSKKLQEKDALEKQITNFHREILSADLHKKDSVSFLEIKKDLESKIKALDQSKRRLDDEIRRLQSSMDLDARRYVIED